MTFFDGSGWRAGVVEAVDGRARLRDDVPSTGLTPLDGVIVGGFTDHHVHLQLVDHAQLAGSRLGRVVDLGGTPDVLRTLAAHRGSVAIGFAGAFLTAPGGYPSDRSWAPKGSVREIADADAAAEAVAEMADAGASHIKVARNSVAGPVLSDDLFRTIVRLAAHRGLPVVAHAEGPCEAPQVARLGAALLAHAPFTERLDDEEIARQAASVSWISTLAIHDGPERGSRSTTCDDSTRQEAPCATAPTWATGRCPST
ncbi:MULTISPECIES: hypothetical protein [unclassified Microbacterium]|uniref:hypothetical protein n=1 Tax=unclassified Microbacterium TaxID=2609290 RepID=UPI0016054AD7|nr:MULTISPECIES: hypothetical protein [unclassified Microbacterium]QNA93497.1 hypothetical protein G4G29_16485 [Microbacterium sp. Se63.02b]QYM63742.1 hypothetical protein K1X59_16550 [Microbacterium sp. Se5.02b]